MPPGIFELQLTELPKPNAVQALWSFVGRGPRHRSASSSAQKHLKETIPIPFGIETHSFACAYRFFLFFETEPEFLGHILAQLCAQARCQGIKRCGNNLMISARPGRPHLRPEIFPLRSCERKLACAMRRRWMRLLTIVGFPFITGLPAHLAREDPAQDKSAAPDVPAATLHATRSPHAGREVGGELAGHPWLVLSAWAVSSPEYFAAYLRDPKAKNSHAVMPGNPGSDNATIAALRAYFQTYSPQEKP
jgi:hypothetical protein